MNCMFCGRDDVLVCGDDYVCDKCFNSRLENADSLRSTFKNAQPYSHLTIDNFFSEVFLDDLLARVPQPDKSSSLGSRYHQLGKHIWSRSSNSLGVDASDSEIAPYLKALNSDRLLKIVEAYTGLKNLLFDPTDWGGGLQQTSRGGRLNIHTDMNQLADTGLYRRVNLILYLNKDWHSEYEGHLELWDNTQPKRKLVKKVAPIYNRVFIFETSEISWHGHPTPLNTPEGVTRKSCAMFFYSKDKGKQNAEWQPAIWLNPDGTINKNSFSNSGY